MWFLKVLPSVYRSVKVNWTQWCMLVILALRKWRQEDVKLKSNLGYLLRPCLKKGGSVELWAVPSFFDMKVSSLDALWTPSSWFLHFGHHSTNHWRPGVTGCFHMCSEARFPIPDLFILVCFCGRLMRALSAPQRWAYPNHQKPRVFCYMAKVVQKNNTASHLTLTLRWTLHQDSKSLKVWET